MNNFDVKSLQVVAHNNQRVLTTEQLAEAYGCKVTNIQTNFHNRKNRFIEGKHYYKLEGDTLKDFKSNLNDFKTVGDSGTNSPVVGKNANVLYLWTEKGAARHSKILDTDKAWDVFEALEDFYFTAKPIVQKLDSYVIDDPVERANRWIEERQAFEAAEAKVKELQPKADVYDTFIDKKGSVGIRDLCNELGITRTRLGQIFKEYKLAYRNPETQQWKPYKTSIDQGFMVVKTGVSPKGYIFAQMRITMKGQQFIAAIAKCEKQLPAAEVKTPSNVISFPDPMKVAYPFDDMDDDTGYGYDDSYDSSIEAERDYDYEKDSYFPE